MADSVPLMLKSVQIRQGSILHVKIADITVCPEIKARSPVGSPTHLLTQHIEGNTGISLNNKLIMDVHDDGAVPQRFHGTAQDVAGSRLHDIFHELGAVGFLPEGSVMNSIPDL